MRLKTLSALLLFLVLASLTCFSQQDYVSRFDIYNGYSFLDAPKLNLFENGYNFEAGWNVKTWVALGFDFSVFSGNSNLTVNELNAKTQAELAPFLPLLPPGYVLAVPFSATTYTYSAGPQFNIRKLKEVTFFVRPALGALHEDVTAHPKNDGIQPLIVAALLPTGRTSDTTVFYGFGGGMDFNLSQHFAVRTAADFVHYDVFTNLLNGGRNAVRFSIGPTVRFGGNIK
jgi:Outer membrane protein beta-barrel domain